MLWQETSQWKQHLNGTDQQWTDCKGRIQQVSCHHCKGNTAPHHHHAYIRSCLVSDSNHIILMKVFHTSAHCSTRLHSPLKTVLGKIGDQYQAYCTMYKIHTMATHHQRCRLPPGQRFGYPHRSPRTWWYQQWQHPQLGCHSCPRRPRSSMTPWRPIIW